MSRTIKKNTKGLGYEYWSRRPPNIMQCPGRFAKIQTHRLERLQAKQQVHQALIDHYENRIEDELEQQQREQGYWEVTQMKWANLTQNT